jgi:hypothetical protein
MYNLSLGRTSQVVSTLQSAQLLFMDSYLSRLRFRLTYSQLIGNESTMFRLTDEHP